jgi:hypothetical protein
MPHARSVVENAASSPVSARMMTDTFDAVWASIEPSFAGRSAEIGDARLALARSVLDFYRAGITQPANLQRMCLRSIRLSHDFIRADSRPPERAATVSR